MGWGSLSSILIEVRAELIEVKRALKENVEYLGMDRVNLVKYFMLLNEKEILYLKRDEECDGGGGCGETRSDTKNLLKTTAETVVSHLCTETNMEKESRVRGVGVDPVVNPAWETYGRTSRYHKKKKNAPGECKDSGWQARRWRCWRYWQLRNWYLGSPKTWTRTGSQTADDDSSKPGDEINEHHEERLDINAFEEPAQIPVQGRKEYLVLPKSWTRTGSQTVDDDSSKPNFETSEHCEERPDINIFDEPAQIPVQRWGVKEDISFEYGLNLLDLACLEAVSNEGQNLVSDTPLETDSTSLVNGLEGAAFDEDYYEWFSSLSNDEQMRVNLASE